MCRYCEFGEGIGEITPRSTSNVFPIQHEGEARGPYWEYITSAEWCNFPYTRAKFAITPLLLEDWNEQTQVKFPQTRLNSYHIIPHGVIMKSLYTPWDIMVKFENVTNIIPCVGSLVKFQSSNSNVSLLRIWRGYLITVK